MNPIFPRAALFVTALVPFSISKTQAQEATSALCKDGQCQPAISALQYQGRRAYKLTDGRAEAIIVPGIGRVMSFGKVGGPNLLWNLAGSPASKGWKNYGGDKTWLAPQSSWKVFHGSDNWPPDSAFDGTPQRVEVVSGGKLRLTTPLSVSGFRLTRLMYFNARGEFVIEQTARKERGAPLRAGLWSITQVVPGDATFFATNSQSAYPNGYFKIQGRGEKQQISSPAPGLLRITPIAGDDGIKFGVDAPVSSLISVRDGVAFLQKSDKPEGTYPDGASGAGFPTELYVNGDAKNFYCEMEILGPLKTFAVGGKSTHTVRWSLHALPSKNVDSSAVTDAVKKLLYTR